MGESGVVFVSVLVVVHVGVVLFTVCLGFGTLARAWRRAGRVAWLSVLRWDFTVSRVWFVSLLFCLPGEGGSAGVERLMMRRNVWWWRRLMTTTIFILVSVVCLG